MIANWALIANNLSYISSMKIQIFVRENLGEQVYTHSRTVFSQETMPDRSKHRYSNVVLQWADEALQGRRNADADVQKLRSSVCEEAPEQMESKNCHTCTGHEVSNQL